MRMKRRRRRRQLAITAGAAYLAAVVWLLAPLWDAPPEDSGGAIPLRAMPAASRPLSSLSLPRVAGLPPYLPDAGTSRGEAETSVATVADEGEAGALVEPIESGTEEPSAPAEGGGSEGAPADSGSAEDKSVIGFEG